MKIAIVGDVHGNWDLLDRIEADLILLTGDTGFIFPECARENHLRIPKSYPEIGNLSEYRAGDKRFSTTTIMIAGNHDCYQCLEKLNNASVNSQGLCISNLFWLCNGNKIEYSFRRANEEKKRTFKLAVAGVGGCYSPSDYDKDWDALLGHHKRHFTRKQVERCSCYSGIDILLLHDGPKGVLSNEDYGCEPLTELIEKVQPKYTFFGHYHRYVEGQIGKTGVIALPKIEDGYCILWDGELKFTKVDQL